MTDDNDQERVLPDPTQFKLMASEVQAVVALIYNSWRNAESEEGAEEETKADRLEGARRVRWFATYNAVLNARHLANDYYTTAHDKACEAAVHAHGPMPKEFEVKP